MHPLSGCPLSVHNNSPDASKTTTDVEILARVCKTTPQSHRTTSPQTISPHRIHAYDFKHVICTLYMFEYICGYKPRSAKRVRDCECEKMVCYVNLRLLCSLANCTNLRIYVGVFLVVLMRECEMRKCTFHASCALFMMYYAWHVRYSRVVFLTYMWFHSNAPGYSVMH